MAHSESRTVHVQCAACVVNNRRRIYDGSRRDQVNKHSNFTDSNGTGRVELQSLVCLCMGEAVPGYEVRKDNEQKRGEVMWIKRSRLREKS